MDATSGANALIVNDSRFRGSEQDYKVCHNSNRYNGWTHICCLNSFEDKYPELVYFAYKCREFIIDMHTLTYFLFRVCLRLHVLMNANSY